MNKNILQILLAFFLIGQCCFGQVDVVYKDLVWSDEFETAGAPDASKWTYDIGAGGWGNNESQYYTNRPENVIVSDGTLKITAK